MSSIDINADLGESSERLENGSDIELMRYITSASIACGGHAGDKSIMRRTLAAARELGLAVGAHPGYPDHKNFGRVELRMPAKALEQTVREQMTALIDLATPIGLQISYVKPHGALYHSASRNLEVAFALACAVQAVDSRLVLVGQTGSAAFEAGLAMGLRCAAEAFADRMYESDGSLRKRTLEGALIESPERAAQQALDIALKRAITLPNGCVLPVTAETICIHSDTPGAARIACAVQEELRAAGICVQALRQSA
ncbi:MAG: 5-oxoprolinase subunit PxpA [Terriglobales bacterium]|jgi:UPF0271 protein